VSTESAKAASALEDYLELFEALAELGIEFVVIGGCAVGAYARLVGEVVFSDDLDLFVTTRALETIVADSSAIGVRVDKLPIPRSVPVAVLKWKGREINLITSTVGLPPPDVEARAAREFRIGAGREVTVLIADPFDLLRNKMAVSRMKDQPHIQVIRRFLEEEAVHAFLHEEDPRARIGPAERLLEVLGAKELDHSLAARLVPLARTPADFRFLAHRVPTRELVEELSSRAPADPIRATIAKIAGSRDKLSG
jgi:hypothetical protein